MILHFFLVELLTKGSERARRSGASDEIEIDLDQVTGMSPHTTVSAAAVHGVAIASSHASKPRSLQQKRKAFTIA